MNNLSNEDVHLFQTMRKIDGTGNLLDLYQDLSSKSAIYPGMGGPNGLTYVALKMNGEAGEFAEHLGKAMRDDDLMIVGEPLKERKELLIKEVGDVLWYLGAACRELGIPLSQAAELNLVKLADRTARKALRGSGDER